MTSPPEYLGPDRWVNEIIFTTEIAASYACGAKNQGV